MLKNKSVLLGIVIIVIVVLAATGCAFYNLLKPEDFRNQFGALGYTISDDKTGEYAAKTYLEASKEDVPFVISYYEFEKEVDAQKTYQNYKKNIVNYITTNSENKETTGAVKSKTVAISEGEYIVISRVKNTLIFIAGTKDYQKQIDKILENLQY